MPHAVRFYRVLGFEIVHGDDNAAFTIFRVGTSYLNLTAQPAERHWSWWGRVIFYNSDVDALYRRVIAAGYRPETAPRDAEWGERFFHLTDPDGHADISAEVWIEIQISRSPNKAPRAAERLPP
jgi:uncharacterized glyoxalase superfamily protein PhnB